MTESPSTKVVHCRQTYDVYIGRPSKWGNPYRIGPDGDRLTVIRKYEQYLRENPDLLAALHELRGKVLGCWCKPLACHGDVLSRLADTYQAALADEPALTDEPALREAL